MKKLIIMLVLMLSVSLLSDLQARRRRSKRTTGNNVIAFSSGLITGREDGIYSGAPFNDWYERAISFYGTFKYLGRVYPSFFIGPYFEYEHVGYDNMGTITGSKIGFGLEFFGRIPAVMTDPVGFELGGIIGYGIFDIGISCFDVLNGVDYGVFLGPVFKLSEQVHMAFHFGAYQGWYMATIPEAVGNPSTRIRMQLYISL